MTLNTLSLSLQFGRFDGVAAHRAVLPRHKVTRWIRHAIKLAKLQGQRELVQSHIGTWRLSNKRKQLSN